MVYSHPEQRAMGPELQVVGGYADDLALSASPVDQHGFGVSGKVGSLPSTSCWLSAIADTASLGGEAVLIRAQSKDGCSRVSAGDGSWSLCG